MIYFTEKDILKIGQRVDSGLDPGFMDSLTSSWSAVYRES